MKAVARESILDLQRYEERRDEIRKHIFEVKAARRVHLGNYLTFLFENADTIRYQVQEMCRAERLWKDADIERELRTYNALLGGEGELGCTLLIEITEAAERAPKLQAWRALPEHLYAVCRTARRSTRASTRASVTSSDSPPSSSCISTRRGPSPWPSVRTSSRWSPRSS